MEEPIVPIHSVQTRGVRADWFCIEEVRLINFRNYPMLTFVPAPRISVLYGQNGAGKTNILESVVYCATGRSPRSVSEDAMLRKGSDHFAVALRYRTSEPQSVAGDQAVSYNGQGGRRAEYNGKRVALQTLVGKLPVVYFCPDDLWLIKTGPGARRALLDRLLTQLEPLYADALTRYRRALLQRNALLHGIRSGARPLSALAIWDAQLVHYGAEIMCRRQAVVERLTVAAQGVFARISSGGNQLMLQYQAGLRDGGTPADDLNWSVRLERALADGIATDVRQGMTGVGPHRDDLVIRMNHQLAKTHASQGQQRIACLAIRLAERDLFRERVGYLPILLLDDVLSELDRTHRARLQNILAEEGQVFLTSTESSTSRIADPSIWSFEVAGDRIGPPTCVPSPM